MDFLEEFDASNEILEDASLIPIYTSLVSKMVLTPEDRESLKKKRGFEDNIIDLLQFKSCIPSNVSIIQNLQKEFPEPDLVNAGILEPSEAGVVPCQQLLGDITGKSNILIPYFNDKQEIFYVRPHKFGLAGRGINLYIPHRTSKRETWIIAESEFKTAATLQLGFPAIGVPGIHSFAKNHFVRLADTLDTLPNLKRVVIIFDNEIKNDPKLPNYKPDVRKQWDTQWRCCHMARIIKEHNASLDVRIGELPAAWMEDGKIDIDGALAKGITSEQFKAVVYASQHLPEYYNSLPQVAQKTIHKKLAREFYKSPLIRRDNAYWVKKVVKKGKDNVTVDHRISNFVFSVEKVLVDGTGYHREVLFSGQDGSTTRVVCPPENISIIQFKRWVNSCGNYIFTGNQEDLDRLYELEYTYCDSREIRRPQGIGEFRKDADRLEENIWLFGNALVKETGEVLTADESGVIWDGLVGYQPASIQEGASEVEATSAKMPMLNLSDVKFGLPEIKEQIVDNLVSLYENTALKLAIGWSIACLYSSEIHAKFSCFPLLFVCGKRGSGKTTLVNYLMALSGFAESSGDAIGASSEAGVLRCLEWFHSVPYWLDEYRNSSKIKSRWEGFLRNVYNRQTTSKGTKGTKIRAHQINAGVILSGEETPEDNALFSRCLIIALSDVRSRKEKKPQIYNKLQELRHKGLMSRLALEVIKRKKSLFPDLLTFIESMKDRLIKSGVSERVAINYAIPASCYYAIFLDKSDDLEAAQKFIQEVAQISFKTEKETESEHMLSIFWEDIVALQEDLKDFFVVYVCPNETKGKKRVALHLKTFYNKWAEAYHRKGNDQFKHGTMLAYIKEEKYFIEDQKAKKLGPSKKTTRCLILSLDPCDDPPPGLKTLASAVMASQDVEVNEDDENQITTVQETPF